MPCLPVTRHLNIGRVTGSFSMEQRKIVCKFNKSCYGFYYTEVVKKAFRYTNGFSTTTYAAIPYSEILLGKAV
jgi:hypothetical protein